jgi:hypothetical protein
MHATAALTRVGEQATLKFIASGLHGCLLFLMGQ